MVRKNLRVRLGDVVSVLQVGVWSSSPRASTLKQQLPAAQQPLCRQTQVRRPAKPTHEHT